MPLRMWKHACAGDSDRTGSWHRKSLPALPVPASAAAIGVTSMRPPSPQFDVHEAMPGGHDASARISMVPISGEIRHEMCVEARLLRNAL